MEKNMSLDSIEIADFEILDPRSLITFSEDYQEHLKVLIPYIKTNEGKTVELLILRLDTPTGSLSKNKFTGIVKNVEDKSFTFFSDFNQTYDFSRETLIHFDSLLGEVPALPDFTKDAFVFNESGILSSFFSKLGEARSLLKNYLGTVHYVEMFFRVVEESTHADLPAKREGTHIVKGELIEVNECNVKMLKKFDLLTWSPDNYILHYIQKESFVGFITPNSYIYKVIFHPGSTLVINPNDDEY